MTGWKLWIPTVSMMLVSLISYIDRNTLALLAPTILKETRLTNEQYGWIISAFSVAYMIGNPVWGRLLDRIGLRVGMTAAVSFWTIASAAHAFATGFWSFAAARAALEFGEGATFPGGLRTSMQTLPPRKRSRGIAVSYSGGSLGAIVTPLIVTPIALWWGWRSAFWFTGLVGAAWLALWMFVSRRPDVRHPREAEHTDAATAAPRWRDLRLWAFLAAYALGASPLAFVLYAAAIYLNQALGASQKLIGQLLWIPPLGWEIGYFFWGWMVDRTQGRAFPRLMTANLLLMLPLAAAPYIPWLGGVMAVLSLAMFVAAGFVIVPIAYATAVYSSRHAGLIAGLGAGSWSLVVALLMPIVGRLFDARRWDTAFLLATAGPVLGYAIWRVLDHTVRNRS